MLGCSFPTPDMVLGPQLPAQAGGDFCQLAPKVCEIIPELPSPASLSWASWSSRGRASHTASASSAPCALTGRKSPRSDEELDSVLDGGPECPGAAFWKPMSQGQAVSGPQTSCAPTGG